MVRNVYNFNSDVEIEDSEKNVWFIVKKSKELTIYPWFYLEMSIYSKTSPTSKYIIDNDYDVWFCILVFTHLKTRYKPDLGDHLYPESNHHQKLLVFYQYFIYLLLLLRKIVFVYDYKDYSPYDISSSPGWKAILAYDLL